MGFELEESRAKTRVRMIVAFLIVFSMIFGVMLYVFREQVRQLGLPENEQELAAELMVKGSLSGLSPKERVYSTVKKSEGWVTAGRVSLSTDLSNLEAEELLEELLLDGRIKSGRDKSDRRLFKVI